MDYCEQVWYEDRELKITSSDREDCSRLLSQTSPSTIRILQAIRFIPPDLIGDDSGYLFKIHFQLDFSWDELRTAICSLRSFIRDDEEGLLTKLLIVVLDPTFFPVLFDLMMWDLACGSVRVMQRTLRGELDIHIM
jgi:hypothetical protein